MNETIASIIAMEWESFQEVQGAGGRASCQDEYNTFEQMRKSQFFAWSEDLCKLYLQDLQDAKRAGRNLISEKYARMMEHTAPQEYERIKHLLPPITDETYSQVDVILAFHLAWQKECTETYPKLAARGRVTEGAGGIADTSFKAYLKGELLTYSPKLLQAYSSYARELYNQGINMNCKILENTVKLAGYSSLADAESKL